MYDQDKDAGGEHWYGVQEAADYLGIHRATMFRAIKSGLIVADRMTPKGRGRFREQTVERFREKLKQQAATNQDHIYAPVRIMAKLANVLATPSPAEDSLAVIHEALDLLCAPGGSFTMACVALHVQSETDPYALHVLAACGFSDRLRASYQCLRPYEDFPANTALRTGIPEICDDLRDHPHPNSTAIRVLAQCNIFAYAAFPLVTGAGALKKAIGVFVVCARAPHKFSPQEQVFLGGIADAVSACISHGVLQANLINSYEAPVLEPERALEVASLLLETAFSQTRQPESASSPASSVAVLCDLFVEQSHALATWIYGFTPQACCSAPGAAQESSVLRQYRDNLKSLVLRARTAGGLKREQWQSKVTAVALPVAHPSGQRGAVGAVWPGVRTEVAAEQILLSTLASACSLVSEC